MSIWKIAIILSIAISLVIWSINLAHGSFKVNMVIDNVNSFSGIHKVKVKLDNGNSKTRTVDLGDKAGKQDDSRIFLYFVFKSSPKWFKACLDGECKKGYNSPEKRPETVIFQLD